MHLYFGIESELTTIFSTITTTIDLHSPTKTKVTNLLEWSVQKTCSKVPVRLYTHENEHCGDPTPAPALRKRQGSWYLFNNCDTLTQMYSTFVSYMLAWKRG